jgi:hypothetical protein
MGPHEFRLQHENVLHVAYLVNLCANSNALATLRSSYPRILPLSGEPPRRFSALFEKLQVSVDRRFHLRQTLFGHSERWPGLFEQDSRFDKWNLCRCYAAMGIGVWLE